MMGSRPNGQSSQVTMRGNFDGRMTYSGRWFIDAQPNEMRPFGYVYRDDDVSDPDGSLPCAACGQLTPPDASARFVVCDLCDQVFHLDCANLNVIPESSWFCSGCTDVRRKFLASTEEKLRLPPTRLWTGHFMIGDKRLSEQFRLTFNWRVSLGEDGVIADVSGKGKNVYGDFNISGKLFAPAPPKTSFPLELKKVYA